MANTPLEEYETALGTLKNAVEDGSVSQDDADAIRKLCSAFDQQDTTESLPRDLYPSKQTNPKKYRTLHAWAERLLAAARELPLTETDADAINRFTTGLAKDEDGPGISHIRNLEFALSKFYRYHDMGVDPRDIDTHEYTNESDNGWDARDLLDHTERAALREVCDHPRDRAILHLALYCGLRNTAIRTLRVKDVRPEDHEWYFNTNADGLKNIHRPSDPRPLFQAERAVRDWLEYHPDPQPDHYLITAKPQWSPCDPTEPVTRQTIRHTMVEQIKETTHERDDVLTVEKPCHPHMMRHNFVSMGRRHPDVTDADIKFWVGHSEDSDVMETTYSHLSSDDHNERGHTAFGTSEAANGSEDDVPPWDATCDHCDRVLAPGETECDTCGTERGETPWSDETDTEDRQIANLGALVIGHFTNGEDPSENEVVSGMLDGMREGMARSVDADADDIDNDDVLDKLGEMDTSDVIDMTE